MAYPPEKQQQSVATQTILAKSIAARHKGTD